MHNPDDKSFVRFRHNIGDFTVLIEYIGFFVEDWIPNIPTTTFISLWLNFLSSPSPSTEQYQTVRLHKMVPEWGPIDRSVFYRKEVSQLHHHSETLRSRKMHDRPAKIHPVSEISNYVQENNNRWNILVVLDASCDNILSTEGEKSLSRTMCISHGQNVFS